MVAIKYVLYKPLLIQWPIQHPKTFATVLEKLWFIKALASPQTSFGVRLSRIHFFPMDGGEMNAWQTNPKGRLRGGYKSICLPTRSLWGPSSTEFQFHETLDLQFVQPSWCLLVSTVYLTQFIRKYIPFINIASRKRKIVTILLMIQRVKKVMSDSPGLVDFAIRLVNSVLNLPEGQVKFFGKFKWQKNRNQCCSSKIFWGYLKDSWCSKY